MISSAEITADPSDPKAPYAVPSITVGTGFHTVSTFYAYMQYTRTGQIGFVLSQLGSGTLAAMGFWWYVSIDHRKMPSLTFCKPHVWDGEGENIQKDWS